MARKVAKDAKKQDLSEPVWGFGRVRYFIFLLLIIAVPKGVVSQKTMYRTIGHQTEGSEGRNAVQAADGGYFMTYYIYYASKFIGCLTKLNCAGQVEWERFYEEDFNALPVDVLAQQDNGCVLLLSLRKNNGEYQNAVLRIDAAGNTLWTQRLNMQAANPTGCLAQHADGSIYTCGVDSIAGVNHIGTTVAKINRDGKLIWLKQYAEYIDHAPRVITVTSDHKIVVAGQAVIFGLFFTNIFVMTIDKNGGFIKRKLFTTYYDDAVTSLCADQSGNIGLTGYSYFLNNGWDMFFLKLNGQLTVLQSKFYDGGSAQGEQARFIAPSSNNTFAVFGDEGGFNERNPALLKLDGDGSLLWSRRYTISPQFTNYIFHGSQCTDGGFLMTGDARPVNQFRIAPFIKTDANGDMGCFNSPLSLTVRNESFTEMDSSLLESTLPLIADTASVSYSNFTILTGNTVFCQNLIPCGTFSWQLDTICPQPCYTFTENSLLADTWLWTFENGTPSTYTGPQPTQVCYTTAGPHHVTLTLTNAIGSISYSQFITPEIACPVLIPNIFTPNGDGINDVFYAKGIYEPFTLKIISRWGLEIYDSDTPGKWWDGYSNNNRAATAGVYFYILTLPESDRIFKGTLELIR